MKLLNRYKQLDRSTFLMIIAEFFMQSINAAFMTILLIHMEKNGFEDHQSANAVAYRFLGVLILAFPLGLYLKGTAIRPIFILSTILVPTLGWWILHAIDTRDIFQLNLSLFLWGCAYTGVQVSILPYILRNTAKSLQSEAISLSHSTWSSGSVWSGIIIFGLAKWNRELFDEGLILKIICSLGLLGFFAMLRLRGKEVIPEVKGKKLDLKEFDWKIIFKTMAPTVVIATGAGLTIPFISLFFFKIHGVDSEHFALLTSFTTVLVFFAVLTMPSLKERFGYVKGITWSQLLAIACLTGLATTEFYADVPGVVYLAFFCYMFRQPLMNLAAPLTSDLIFNYVGDKNREMISALTAAIWSGSWFISSKIFELLRTMDVAYHNIFYITAGLYLTGVWLYRRLAIEYEQKMANE